MGISDKECNSTRESDAENDQNDNTEFVQVNTEKDDNDKDCSKGRTIFDIMNYYCHEII